MKLEVEETGPVERRLRVELPTVAVDAAFDVVYQQLRRRARLPGFRKGKIPRSILERYFGENARGDVLQQLIRESLPKAIAEAELDVLGDPRLQPAEQPKPGAAFGYEVVVEIRPQIELKKVRALEVTCPTLPEPKDDPVEAHLEELRAAHGQLVEEREGATAASGHFAVIDYDGLVDGSPFEGGKGRERTLELCGDRSIPGFEDQLVGMVVGEERDFELELPENYPENLAGKRATFHVKLLELKRRVLPELDDEFAKDVSELETLGELRADLQRRVEERREAERKRLLQDAAADALIQANPFPVPEGLVTRQLESRLAQALSSFRGRMPEEQVREMAERWREEWRPLAERDVRLALLVPAISDAEKIEVASEDIDEQLRRIADQKGQPLDRLKREYRQQGLLEALERSLLEQRVLAFLVSEATLSGG